MKKWIENRMIASLRGLVWAAMIGGCAWASAQSYVVLSGHYDAAGARYQAMALHYSTMRAAAGEGVMLTQGESAAEGAQSSAPLPKDDLFAGTEGLAKNATHVTEITMDPDSLSMVGGRDSAKAHSMVLNVVRTYEYDKPGMYNMADVEAIRNKLNTGDWHCSVHVRDLKTGEGQDICSRHRTDGLREEAIIEVEPKELTLIHKIWRPNGPGSSDLGFFPIMRGLGPGAMMAMTDPEAFADMQIGMSGMPFILNAEPNVMFRMNQFRVEPFNQQQMKELQNHLKDLKPFNPEQLQKLDKQFKDFDKEFKDKSDKAPAAPEAEPAPAPAAPQPPE